MRGTIILMASAMLAAPALAQNGTEKPAPPPKSALEQDRKASDIVTSPLSDVNAKRREVPPIVADALAAPYDLTGLRRCREIVAAVAQLDEALGPDVDAKPAEESRGRKTGQGAIAVTSSVVSSFIPFRGVIREISGANKAEEDYRVAIVAGIARRSFLKGYGRSQRCIGLASAP